MSNIKNYINGNTTCFSSKMKDIIDPSTGDKIGTVVLSNEKDLYKKL